MANPDKYRSEREWAIHQLEDVQAREHEAELVMRMLEEWWDDRLQPGDDVWRALGLFEQLARGKALPTPEQADVNWSWAPARPGQLVVRDYVRVKADAYDGPTGRMHNGRSGPIVRISAGDVLVKYDDGKLPEVTGLPPRHSPHKLEKRYRA